MDAESSNVTVAEEHLSSLDAATAARISYKCSTIEEVVQQQGGEVRLSILGL